MVGLRQVFKQKRKKEKAELIGWLGWGHVLCGGGVEFYKQPIAIIHLMDIVTGEDWVLREWFTGSFFGNGQFTATFPSIHPLFFSCTHPRDIHVYESWHRTTIPPVYSVHHRQWNFNSYENYVYTLQNTLTIFQQLLPHQIWIRIWVGLACKAATCRTLTKIGPKKKNFNPKKY